MIKNTLIKRRLEYHINNSKKLFKKYSFPKLLKHELSTFDDVVFGSQAPDYDVVAAKAESKNELINLLNDKALHGQLEHLLNLTLDVNEKEIQEHIENQLIKAFSAISTNISDEKIPFKLNLLFLERDYSPDACFSGFEDPNYQFDILSGHEYLEYETDKLLFNGVGNFDYTPFLLPSLKFETEIGEDKVHAINEAISTFGYLEEVKKYFLLYAYLQWFVSVKRRFCRIPIVIYKRDDFLHGVGLVHTL